jgi:hypothetical protein
MRRILFSVISAEAGIQSFKQLQDFWIPASAEMTTYCEAIKRVGHLQRFPAPCESGQGRGYFSRAVATLKRHDCFSNLSKLVETIFHGYNGPIGPKETTG